MTAATPAGVSAAGPASDRPALLRETPASIRTLEGSDLAFEILVGNHGR